VVRLAAALGVDRQAYQETALGVDSTQETALVVVSTQETALAVDSPQGTALAVDSVIVLLAPTLATFELVAAGPSQNAQGEHALRELCVQDRQAHQETALVVDSPQETALAVDSAIMSLAPTLATFKLVAVGPSQNAQEEHAQLELCVHAVDKCPM